MPYLSMNCTKIFAKCRYYGVFTVKSTEIPGIYTVLAYKYTSEDFTGEHTIRTLV
jgi:hypothetical protein